MSSARVSSSPSHLSGKSNEEEDQFKRSKKKVRSWDNLEEDQPEAAEWGIPVAKQGDSYKERLLNLFGEEVSEKLVVQETSTTKDGEPLGDSVKAKQIGMGLEIPLSDEEWTSWSKPWHKTLVTKVLGKNVNFKTLESFMQRRWIKHGTLFRLWTWLTATFWFTSLRMPIIITHYLKDIG